MCENLSVRFNLYYSVQVCNFKTQHYGRSMLFIECFENTKRVFVLSIDKNVFFFRVLDTNNGIIYHRKYKFVNKICYLYLYWYEIWNSKKKCSFFILFVFLPKINRYDVFNFEKNPKNRNSDNPMMFYVSLY